jgi:glycosyltransferase involved in cell wall biosynthesis
MAKVCIVRHAYYPQETHVRRNAETLTQQGHQVTLVCLRDTDQSAEENINGVNVYRLPVRHYRRSVWRYLFEYSTFFLLAFFALGFLYLRKRFEVIEVDSMPDFLVFSSLIPKLMGARVILYLFEAMPEEFVSKYRLSSNHWMRYILGWIEQVAIRYADHVLTACNAFRQVFVSRGADREKITVILNVPNDNVFQLVRNIHIPLAEKTDFIVITHGTLIELYGVQVIIQAMKQLREQIPGIRLLIAGDGEYADTLKQLARDIGVSDIVSFLGWIPQLDIAHLIFDADVGVVPIQSGYGELMVPNKIFEYVAMERPVVCASLRGIRDYFPEDTVVYFIPGSVDDLAKSLLKVFYHSTQMLQMVKRANHVYQENRWEVAKFIYLDVLLGPR